MHVDGDDYTYESICTAAQHQAAQDVRITGLEIDIAAAQVTIAALIENLISSK